MKAFIPILKQDILNLFTNRMWLFYTIGFPLLLVLTLGFLSEGAYGVTITSYDYYGVTIMIFSALNAATLAANSFLEQRIKSANMRIVYAPIKGDAIYVSKIVATMVFTTVCYSVVGILLALLFHVNFGGQNAIYLWLLMLMVQWFAICFSIMMCCILKSEEVTNTIVSNALTLLAVLGGLFFPIASFGLWMEWISNLSPVKWIVCSSFQIIYDHNFDLFLPTIALLLILSLLCLFMSNRMFKTEEMI